MEKVNYKHVFYVLLFLLSFASFADSFYEEINIINYYEDNTTDEITPIYAFRKTESPFVTQLTDDSFFLLHLNDDLFSPEAIKRKIPQLVQVQEHLRSADNNNSTLYMLDSIQLLPTITHNLNFDGEIEKYLWHVTSMNSANKNQLLLANGFAPTMEHQFLFPFLLDFTDKKKLLGSGFYLKIKKEKIDAKAYTALCFDLLQGYESSKLDLFLEIPHYYFSGSTKHTMHNFYSTSYWSFRYHFIQGGIEARGATDYHTEHYLGFNTHIRFYYEKEATQHMWALFSISNNEYTQIEEKSFLAELYNLNKTWQAGFRYSLRTTIISMYLDFFGYENSNPLSTNFHGITQIFPAGTCALLWHAKYIDFRTQASFFYASANPSFQSVFGFKTHVLKGFSFSYTLAHELTTTLSTLLFDNYAKISYFYSYFGELFLESQIKAWVFPQQLFEASFVAGIRILL